MRDKDYKEKIKAIGERAEREKLRAEEISLETITKISTDIKNKKKKNSQKGGI
jgi:hypothetical protein